MLSLLPSRPLIRNVVRHRASYYKEKKFPPAFVRRFFLRYPNAHLWIVFGLCSSAMVGPVLHSCYLYLTMSKEEFGLYKEEHTAVVRDRQKYGKNLWIPFVSSGKPDVTETANSS